MKHISLIRIDEEAEEINISLGDAVIGRGQLLKCTDKRISRNHGLINLSEKGDVILTSKHLNPIYYSEKKCPLVEIHSGHSVILKNGDEFALLPDSCRFRVAILSDNETKNIQNGCINGDKETINNEIQKTECLKIKQEIQSESEKLENAVDDSLYQYTSDPNRIRKLPSWMTNTSQDASMPGTSTAVKKERKRKDNVKSETNNKKAKVMSKNKKKNTDKCSGDEDGNDELQSQVSKNHQGKKTDDDGSDSDKNEMDVDSKICGSSASGNKTKLHELSDEEEQEQRKNDEVKTTAETSNEGKKSDDAEQSGDQPASSGDQKVATNNTRQKCLYGAGCYRKNPQHRRDHSHPGDADYDDGNVPECPYGLSCYRKNKQHRLDYKHTTMPQQQNNPQNTKKKNTGNRKNNTAAYDDDDEEDDYDYDDPFLNDASSDDYQPTDSGSENSAASSEGEDEDDTKRMLKEAKRFTKKKK